MIIKPRFGKWLAVDILDSIDKYVLITMEEPWNIIENKISNKPAYLEFNYDMSIESLEKFYISFEPFITDDHAIVGMGGGTACDSAKFLAWKFKEEFNFNWDLYLIPSIISVDAFLCSSIAVRVDNKVNYVGESNPKDIIIDYELIKEAPKSLNRAGVSDTISIASALGDWLIAREETNEKFNQDVFNKAEKIVNELMSARKEIRNVTENGIKALVNGFYEEVSLCENWGNARPEEGSEHFLAYCLESITHDHYIHGNLIGMNILISLYLQHQYAQFALDQVKQFFEDIQLSFTAESQNISYNNLRTALNQVKTYVIDEQLFYSIYNSPKLVLDKEKIEEILSFIKFS
ncbi:MAG: iron-containing alcohol dehydrogenase [Promethearchaeota archaeon]